MREKYVKSICYDWEWDIGFDRLIVRWVSPCWFSPRSPTWQGTIQSDQSPNQILFTVYSVQYYHELYLFSHKCFLALLPKDNSHS